MADIQPFTISIPGKQLDDLKLRLSLARFPDELDEAGWEYGAPLADIKRITQYWKENYDWRAAEHRLNATFLQFTTSITVEGFDPIKLHFIHQRSRIANAIPLLFVHGWPGSFIEALKIVQELSSPSDPKAPAFHVIAPSLPNFGFSEAPKKKGFAVAQYAEIVHKLMLKLGYTEYATQAGDWGFHITRTLCLHYPQHCKAIHVNMDEGSQPKFTSNPLLALEYATTPFTEREIKGRERTEWMLRESSGYRTQQSTKPQTLGYSLADSPVGLLSWIYEKICEWSDKYPWTEDEICTWMSIYWFSTAGPAASLRIYYEEVHRWDDPARRVTRDRTRQYIGGVKLGLTHSPAEVRVYPSTWTRTQGDVVFERFYDSGGHFFAYEKPEHLIADVRDMYGRGGGAEGVIKGKNGY
ncbi:uncharacterized protein A1O9_09940 [Exophiala aquamarina CBS 119918]|uniref:Epoxide hydrolase N-terminal domain-containing protein n=1 Tax=Exophiala aquamarina CBS 119918 TaxID=1182545 RepID=A0A072PEY8_9EURO|nr:uncharacterized protein A1O9_09940 [Exophiala aquamarina CBS 119918]KEF54145.1 hypothetical protein A1O9_09940 [Exophiala aquamarina CBS 119918]